jgi:delta8-fatty-acid desaturase
MHTQTTLQAIKRYRIGRTVGQWKNMTPPIQGGIYHTKEEDDAGAPPGDASIITDDDQQDSGINCDTTFDTSSVDLPLKKRLCKQLSHGQDNAIERVDSAVDVAHKHTATTRLRSPAELVANTVQQEIDADIAKYPSLDFDTQRDIALRFEVLHQRVKNEGFYQCRFIEYGKEILRYSALFALFIFTLKTAWYFASACFLGLFWHQIMFTAHDAGHRGITKNITADTLIGIFIADFCCGLSIEWWKSSHNVHHLVTNAPVSSLH